MSVRNYSEIIYFEKFYLEIIYQSLINNREYKYGFLNISKSKFFTYLCINLHKRSDRYLYEINQIMGNKIIIFL